VRVSGRRSKKCWGKSGATPASAWHRITLPALTRTFRTPKVLVSQIQLADYKGPCAKSRSPSWATRNHRPFDQPLALQLPTLVTRYAHRMLIENGISEAIQFFHLDALSSMVGLKVDFDLQIT